ncbi:MAG: HAMP domain-containing histidine kinase [Candidatus Gastranaerophilales bacterium]|nr:HAMP domain-containing histidine kinase [Candidatus Gastranaerophilales bacterium]
MRYFINLCALLILVFLGNIVVLAWINIKTESETAYVRTSLINSCLSKDGEGRYVLSQEGVEQLAYYRAFAMLIGEDGKVVWEYNMPAELPREYSRLDVAAFSRWYLGGYPVFSRILEDGILVVGKEKDSVWRYNWIENLDTLNAYVKYVPYILLINLLMVTIIPFFLVRRQMRRGERERTAWIAGVSHDIRTPLALIIGTASALRQDSMEMDVVCLYPQSKIGGEERLAEKAAMIEKQALRIRTLVSNLNMENKLNYGMGNWEKSEIQIAALLREVVCDVINRGVGESHSFAVEIDRGAEQFTARGDRELVRRLLENLINNSVEHNPEGCHITVRLEQRAAFPYRSVLTVEDDGCGISGEQLKAFHGSLRQDSLPEHGLGIRIVRRIAAMYRWRVKFETVETGGLRCCIFLRGRLE